MRQIVFDVETTGLSFADGHRIVEIGAVELVRGAVTGRAFHAYVNPERDMPDAAYRVHGLSTDFLRDKPPFRSEKVAGAFLDFVGDAELVAHNGADFDLPFINAELETAGYAPLTNPLVDTLIVARRKFPGSPASLDALCARFGVSTSERVRDGHGALLDARLLAQVYVELTGGAQAGLGFDIQKSALAVAQGAARPARPRPVALPSLLTPDEAVAHALFVASLGPAALWLGPTSRTPASPAPAGDSAEELHEEFA
jgi:DNA polymerase-3 subunit epsilon